MSIEELAYHKTKLGELVLRRRPEPALGGMDVFEVKLGNEFLMSSLFVEAEVELANLGLKGLGAGLDVVVGGLGLGYTAAAALDHSSVSSLLVIDLFEEVIDWHRKGLVPMGKRISGDARCELKQGDFFELSKTGFPGKGPDSLFDAVLLDIDHSPSHFLDEKNGGFYTPTGLGILKRQIAKDGVFALWSNDPPDLNFTDVLDGVFGKAEGHEIEFRNPYTGGSSLNSVYVATNAR